jgi:hypothetical protein
MARFKEKKKIRPYQKYFCILMACLFITIGEGKSVAVKESMVKRDILALWYKDGEYLVDSSDDYIHTKLEMVFNHYGYKLDFIDISKGLPKKLWDPKKMEKYVAVVTWFRENSIKDPLEYLNWIEKQLKKKKKLIVLGEFGVQHGKKSKVSLTHMNQKLKRWGVEYLDGYYNRPLFIEVDKKDKEMAVFLRP